MYEPVSDPRFDGFTDLGNVHPHIQREIREFFQICKRLEPKKWARYRAWKNAVDAKGIVK